MDRAKTGGADCMEDKNDNKRNLLENIKFGAARLLSTEKRQMRLSKIQLARFNGRKRFLQRAGRGHPNKSHHEVIARKPTGSR